MNIQRLDLIPLLIYYVTDLEYVSTYLEPLTKYYTYLLSVVGKLFSNLLHSFVGICFYTFPPAPKVTGLGNYFLI